MKTHIKTLTIAAVTASLIFTGCETTPDGRLTQAQGAGIGALGGALLGGVLGYMADGERGALAGAALGGALGGVSGFAYGTHVAGKKKQYASTESYLNACIAAAIERNNRAIAFNQELSMRIAELEEKAAIAIANNDQEAKMEIKAAIANLQNQTKVEIQAINKEISIQNQVLKAEAGSRSSKLGSLRSQVAALQNTKAVSERELSRLASLDNRLDA